MSGVTIDRSRPEPCCEKLLIQSVVPHNVGWLRAAQPSPSIGRREHRPPGRSISDARDAVAAREGITPVGAELLLAVREPRPQGVVAEALGLTEPRLSVLASKLVDRKLVRRRTTKGDKRFRILELTAAGRPAADRIEQNRAALGPLGGLSMPRSSSSPACSPPSSRRRPDQAAGARAYELIVGCSSNVLSMRAKRRRIDSRLSSCGST